MQYNVTIGIPVYQAVDYIKNTMESALNQTYSEIEFLIVDDCGGDGSMRVVERLKCEHPRGNDIRIVRNGRNLGVGVSRNRILKEARGRYLFFLDSDDLLEEDTIEKMVRSAYEHQAEAVYGSWERVDNVTHSSSQYYVYSYQELLQPESMALYAFKNYSSFMISSCNCLMDVEFLRNKRLRFIDTNFWEDLAFSYELVTEVSRAVLLSDITYHYLCRPGSLSNYQQRDLLQKTEILRNAETIGYLKGKCISLVGKPYLPYLCYNLEMNSFYIVCHVLRHANKIVPRMSYSEMMTILRHPLDISVILGFRAKLLQNLWFCMLGRLPLPLSVFFVRILGKLKKAI